MSELADVRRDVPLNRDTHTMVQTLAGMAIEKLLDTAMSISNGFDQRKPSRIDFVLASDVQYERQHGGLRFTVVGIFTDYGYSSTFVQAARNSSNRDRMTTFRIVSFTSLGFDSMHEYAPVEQVKRIGEAA